MGQTKKSAGIAIAIGIVLLILAGVYWALPAGSLPAFLPGHEANSPDHHVKHGLAAFALGVFCFVLAWFQTGPQRPA